MQPLLLYFSPISNVFTKNYTTLWFEILCQLLIHTFVPGQEIQLPSPHPLSSAGMLSRNRMQLVPAGAECSSSEICLPGVSAFQELLVYGWLPEMNSLHAKGLWWGKSWRKLCRAGSLCCCRKWFTDCWKGICTLLEQILWYFCPVWKSAAPKEKHFAVQRQWQELRI